MAGEKRGFVETDERLELCSKKPKTQDLNSIFNSAERIRKVDAEHAGPIGLDLNANVADVVNVVGNKTQAHFKATDNATVFRRQEVEYEFASKSRLFGLDLNAEDVSSSINNYPFHPCKNLDHVKSKDKSECASSMVSLEERDPLQVWKEMKQKGFLSSSHGCVSMPTLRGKNAKSDGVKNKIDIAKREQVDRFAKIAAPSGLLNGLNPGIINHVRNSKQVHSIIEALVKSEKDGSLHSVSKSASKTKCETKGFSEQTCEKGVMHNPGEYKFNHVAQLLEPLLSCQMKSYPGSINRPVSMTSNLGRGDGPSCTTELRPFGVTANTSHLSPRFEDGLLEMKMSSARAQSENVSSLSNEDSVKITSADSLSVKAARVAFQWLELLHHDVKGRLAALRCSKKRVHEVIHTELPCMLSREYSTTQGSNLSTIQSSASHSSNATAEMHHTRWGSLFHQMDISLLEEEKQLENWLSQVKQMQVHCSMGLFNYNAADELPQINNVDDDSRLKKADKLERDLSVRAAAASIYSTCNFLSSMENLPCC